jgi:alkylation response protein AidB-like acyl-CoA dehydrogenase
MVTATNVEDLVGVAKSFAPRIEAARDRSERERSMPGELARALAEAGLFRIWVPRALGGFETDIATNIRIVEEVSRVDGAAGWNVMIAATGGMFAAYLPPDAGREIYGDSNVITAGAIAPKGRAVPEGNGYRVSGRWPLASGCHNAAWLGGGSFIFENEAPRLASNGIPDLHFFFFPKEEVTILDTWYSGGLRGTGSHDIEVQDAFVPADRTFSIVESKPFYDGTLYRSSIISIFGMPLAAVALGIARAAIDDFIELAGGKTPAMTAALLRDRPTVQAQVGEAEALLRSARSFLLDAAAASWEQMLKGGPLTEEQEAVNRLAGTYTARSCARAVDLVHDLAGATSVYESSKLERCFRDVHVVTQHIIVGQSWYERTGKYFLGLGLQRFG